MPTSICEYIGANFGVEPASFELAGKQVLDLPGDVNDQAGERSGRRGDGGVAHQDAKPVGVLLDVGQQREGGLLEKPPRMVAGECPFDPCPATSASRGRR